MPPQGEINTLHNAAHLGLNSGPTPHRSMKPIKLRNTSSYQISMDVLHHKSTPKIPAQCQEYSACVGALMRQTREFMSHVRGRSTAELLSDAHSFMEQYYASIKSANSEAHELRLREISEEVQATGTYKLTEPELTYGAKMAWRNAARCIGRIQWQKLSLFDAQHITTAREMFDAICNHIRVATNGGNLKSVITVFPPRVKGRPDFRLWNPQLLSYAGYADTEATANEIIGSESKCPIRGDPQNVEFTKVCIKLGWKPPGTPWDILPIVVNVPGEDPELFPIPEELVCRIPIIHPKYDWFKELNLQWYALPAVSNMMFDVGGIEYPACPFSGWYMDTEVAVRDLADPHRYNILPTVAQKMGLDTSSNISLWKDQAIVEVNIAVLYSYQKANVTIMDHHSAAESFMKHLENENRLRGGCPADWVWIVPPISGSLTPVYYQEMLNYELKPAYLYQEPAWKTHVWQKLKSSEPQKRLKLKEAFFAVFFAATLFSKILSKRIRATIVYATETGRSEMFAQRLSLIFANAFNVSVTCMDEYDLKNLEHEALLLIVVSTFGNGDPPENGETFSKQLATIRMASEKALKSKQARFTGKFAVFGLGSTAYPNFCAFGRHLDTILGELGGVRINKVGMGDELSGQEQSFNEWAKQAFDSACDVFGCFASSYDMQEVMSRAIMETPAWSKADIRLQEYMQTPDEIKKALPKAKRIEHALTTLSNHKKVMCYKLLEREFLTGTHEQENSVPKTIRVMLRTNIKDEEDGGRPPEDYYQPGDHLAVYPQNESLLVSGICDRVSEYLEDVDPDWPYIIKHAAREATVDANNNAEKEWILHEKLPAPVSLREALTRYLDITTPPSQQFLKLLTDTVESDKEKERLKQLFSNGTAYEEWKSEKVPNLLEVLSEFSSAKPPLELLFTQLPTLQPRYYSISSSPLDSTNTSTLHVELTIAVVQYTTSAGAAHNGVCSNFLAQFTLGQNVYGFLRNAPNFHLPKEPNVPIMMIGPGTGIAPFRAFWEHRYKLKSLNPVADFGKMKLFFGCRYPAMQLYRREIEDMILEDIISEYYVAYSRKPGKPKKYVQDKMRLMSKAIYKTLMEQNGHIYVCGDVAMAEEVHQTLKAILIENDVADAEEVVNSLKENNRYHEDIFGITKRTVEPPPAVPKEMGNGIMSNGNGNGHLKNSTLLSKSTIIFSKDKKIDLRFWKKWLING